ncbi:hypothetical protein PRIPAC_92475 [Pristionchus pacificus]|uniref:Uncharacterized protein n=1 Tax=Pristionchus pacificus TaxID=54126 RepID=A0A2A6BQM6_PRIPA|nr:hypothetical protein PRIPAC_92475 [Pristionchus pacificus]|eukprot:PDM68093.1 hypothetical protein PRIPAC_46137 [Pristionchus pacificus]
MKVEELKGHSKPVVSSSVSGGTIALIITFTVFSAMTIAIEAASIFIDTWTWLGPINFNYDDKKSGEYGKLGLLTITDYNGEWETHFFSPSAGNILFLLIQIAFIIVHVAAIIVMICSKWGNADNRRSAMRIILFPCITVFMAPILFVYFFLDLNKNVESKLKPPVSNILDHPPVPASVCTWLMIIVNVVYFWVALIASCCCIPSSPVSGGTVSIIVVFTLFSAATVVIEAASIFVDNWAWLGPAHYNYNFTPVGEYGRMGLITITDYDSEAGQWETYMFSPSAGHLVLLMIQIRFLVAHVLAIFNIVGSTWSDDNKTVDPLNVIIIFPCITFLLAPLLLILPSFVFDLEVEHKLEIPNDTVHPPPVPAYLCTWLMIIFNFVYFWVS